MWTGRVLAAALGWGRGGWPGRLRGAGRSVARLVFPPRCVSCDADMAVGPVGPLVCAACREALVRPSGPRCGRCGVETPSRHEDGTPCPACRGGRLAFENVYVLGNYEGPLRDAVLRTKHAHEQALAVALGELLWGRAGAQLTSWKADALVAVPMHWWRRLHRGTNGAEILAGVLARRLALPLADRMLVRRRNTKPQGSLTSAGRFENVRRAFRLRAGCPLQGARILLVDDVLTTGATAGEIAKLLKGAGAAAVAVAVVARAEGPDRRQP